MHCVELARQDKTGGRHHVPDRMASPGETPSILYHLLIPLLLSRDQRGDAYFLFYALLKDKQGVDLAACDILHITQ
jgi:hypothetical protein